MCTSATRPGVKEEPVLLEVAWVTGDSSADSRPESDSSPVDEEDILCEFMGFMNFKECLTEGNVPTGAELQDPAFYIPLSFAKARKGPCRTEGEEEGYDWLWTRWMWGDRGKKRSREYPVPDKKDVKKCRLR